MIIIMMFDSMVNGELKNVYERQPNQTIYMIDYSVSMGSYHKNTRKGKQENENRWMLMKQQIMKFCT